MERRSIGQFSSRGSPTSLQRLLKYADSQGFAYMLETGQSICTIFQAASASAAKSKTTKGSAVVAGSGTLDLGTYDVKVAKVIKEEFNKTSVVTSVAHAVRGNRTDKLGSNWADAGKCGLTEDELEKAHDVLDVKYLREVNRTLARTLHDAVFSGRL